MKDEKPLRVMTREEHIERHKLLHQHLDELVADWIGRTSNTPSQKTVMDLVKWSYSQTLNPTENDNGI